MMVADRVALKPEVLNITGLSEATVHRMEKAGQFPQRVKISAKRVGWRLSEIQEWVKSRQSEAPQVMPKSPGRYGKKSAA